MEINITLIELLIALLDTGCTSDQHKVVFDAVWNTLSTEEQSLYFAISNQAWLARKALSDRLEALEHA